MFTSILIGCQQEPGVIFNTPNGFIQIDKTSSSIDENSEIPITISIQFGGSVSQNTSGITANFTVASSDLTRFTVSPSTGTIEIPVGELSADITFTPIDNLIADGALDVVIELSAEGNNIPIGLGGEGILNTISTITILDNDCAIILEEMVGNYSGTDNWIASAGGPLKPKITTSIDGSSFNITGVGYAWLENPSFWGEPVVAESSITIDIDLITGEFEIPYTYTATTIYNGDLYNYYAKGKGKYYACSDTFELEYELFWAPDDDVASAFGAPGFVWRETLIRQ